MSLTGYDLVALGNHEFDYQMDGMFNRVNAADFPYVSCNFTDIRTNQPVFDAYRIIERENVTDKDGKNVVLTQTGQYFSSVGKLTIFSNGTISTELIDQYDNFKALVRTERDKWVAEVDKKLCNKIADSTIDLKITDDDGNRIVRRMECSMGDFVTDAYYYYVNEIENINCDVVIVNGGGIRADISTGAITYKEMKNVSPFGNVMR